MRPPTCGVGVVVLTMGNRPVELARAVRSVLDQPGPASDVLVVGNGVDVPDGAGRRPHPARCRRTSASSAAATSAGASWTTSSSSSWTTTPGCSSDDVLDRVRAAFAADDRLGIVSMRIVDPETGLSSRRHVPRLRASDPERSSEVTTFLGGANVMRRAVLEQCGGLPSAFWYGHEETDLAWAALDAGWRIRYDADAVAGHPTTTPARHETYYRLNARNRVWLARRRLPAPLVVAYLGVWTALTVVRVRDRRSLRVWGQGFVEGWRTDPGPRRPMRWRTVWRMTRLGRPPLV